MEGTVELVHRETGTSKRVAADDVETYRGRGWLPPGEYAELRRAEAEEEAGPAGAPYEAAPAAPPPLESVAPPRLAPIRIAVSPAGTSLSVGGQEISPYVGAYTLEAQGGHPPMLSLYGVPDGVIEDDAVVVVVRDREEREAIAAFLGSIDPAELERLVLADPDLGSGSMMPVVLTVLRRLAVGQG